MIFLEPFPDVGTPGSFTALVGTSLVPGSVQRMHCTLSVGGESAGAFMVYFDTDIVPVPLGSRLKRFLVPAMPYGVLSQTALPVVSFSATEYTDGTAGDSIGPTTGVLTPSAAETFLLSGTKFWVGKSGKFPIYLQNTSGAAKDVSFTVTAYTRLGNSAHSFDYSVENNCLACYSFPIASYFVPNCYKISISATVGAEIVGDIELYIQKSEFFKKEFYFLNDFSVWQAWHAVGGETKKTAREVASFEYESKFGQQFRRSWQEFEFTSQPMPKAEAEYYEAVLRSKKVYVLENSVFVEIFVTSASVDGTDSDQEVSRLKFSYRNAEIQE